MSPQPHSLARDPRHLLPWGAALLIYLGVFHRVVRILEIDFEALVMNLYQIHEASLDWLPRGRAAVLAGAAPLTVVVLARLLYRLLRRWLGLTFPPARWSRLARLALGTALLLPYLAFCVPASVAVGVWVSMEVFAWLEWFEQVFPIMAITLFKVPYLAMAGGALLGILLAWTAARTAVPVAPAAGLKHKLSRLAWRSMVVLLFVPFLPLAALAGIHLARAYPATGLDTYKDKCGGCHIRAQALYFTKTPAEWRRTITRMKAFEKAPINEEQKEEVISFLTGMRSYSDDWIFRTRCQRCHHTNYRDWQDRAPADWAALVDRVGRWSPYYYSRDIKAQLVAHLTRTASTPDATLGLTAQAYRSFKTLEKRCGQCHSLGREAERFSAANETDVAEMMSRMNQKMPRRLEAAELRALNRTYRDIIKDPKRLKELVPHDQPPPDTGPAWLPDAYDGAPPEPVMMPHGVKP